MSHANLDNSSGAYRPELIQKPVDVQRFPAGEPRVTLSPYFVRDVIQSGVLDTRDIGYGYIDPFVLCQVADILNQVVDVSGITLFMPYMPCSRQDRRVFPGTSFALREYAKVINSIGFRKVVTVDAHSDVCEALYPSFENIRNITLVSNFCTFHLAVNEETLFLAPDAGAAKKLPGTLREVDTGLNIALATADKERDLATGEILRTVVPEAPVCTANRIVVVDDICDGGRTFVELAKEVQRVRTANAYGPIPMHLVVSHAIMSKGAQALDGYETLHAYDTFQRLPGVNYVETPSAV